MRIQADFAYAQTRMQARHGLRLADGEWTALESAQAFALYLDRARATSLKRFLGKIDAAMPIATIESGIRQEAAAYVDEVAAWQPARWRRACAWMAALPALPLLGGTDGDTRNLETLPEVSAVVAGSATEGAGARWLASWRALWPREPEAQAELKHLIASMGRRLRAGDGNRDQTAGEGGRAPLAALLNRAFRSHPASPVAVVAHIGLTFLDLERLRGGLARRRLFGAIEGKAAA